MYYANGKRPEAADLASDSVQIAERSFCLRADVSAFVSSMVYQLVQTHPLCKCRLAEVWESMVRRVEVWA